MEGRLALEFNRTWSVPSSDVPDDVVIANILARPTLGDLTTVCMRFGCPRVHDILRLLEQNNEIGPYAKAASHRMLANIEAGLARAQGHSSESNQAAS